MTGRRFRLAVQAPNEDVTVEAEGCDELARRWSPADQSVYVYLTVPATPGDLCVRAKHAGEAAEETVQVRTLEQFRACHTFNGVDWPRRWPLGKSYTSVKARQTLQSEPVPGSVDTAQVAWWLSQSDETIWNQLPPAELPKAHFANAHQGCPVCGTAIFRFGGFYPWKRNHLPCDFKSTCPSCSSVFPSNDLMNQDYLSGQYPDDGFGYTDEDGHLFLFAATYHRDQCRSFASGVSALTNHLRVNGMDEAAARCLAVMLLRYAVEEAYVASAVQFRYGPSRAVEEQWPGGQTDWAVEPDPVKALVSKGSIRYSIDTPYLADTVALAYDTIWPLVREDQGVVSRAQSLGVPVATPGEASGLMEEMLAALLQCVLDRGAGSNLPRESVGALVLLRALDRPDAQGAVDWLYDEGPDRLRLFSTNDFFPDGTPPESTGGYNSIHTNGLFEVEHSLRQLRAGQPEAYPEERYPSLMSDPRTANAGRQPNEITMIGKAYFQFGDGHAPGTGAEMLAHPDASTGSLRLEENCFHAPMAAKSLDRAAEYTGDPVVEEIRRATTAGEHRRIGSTVHDGVGIAILRTGECPERAAVGIVYGDTTGHRHRDLLDVQLFAFERPFLTDLGYPQSWASRPLWEDHWGTHNTAWGTGSDVESRPGYLGRGRLIRSLCVDGVQILDVEAYQWMRDSERNQWYRPGVTLRRLIALVKTDGEGVALVDLSRVRGGTEHWRTCRGLEGELHAPEAGLQSRGGTVADPNGERGARDNLRHADHAAFAFMDKVASAAAPASWTGHWQSGVEASVCLDLHQVSVSDETELLTARATAMMGTPEESGYCYRTALWRREPRDENDASSVDLVMEPRVGEATLAEAWGIGADTAGASGVDLVTRQGKRIRIYWAPDAGADGTTEFEDGTRMTGPLAVVADKAVHTMGVRTFACTDGKVDVPDAVQTRRITALDRGKNTVDVAGLQRVMPGERVVVNPEGRGHSYRVEAVEKLDGETTRLTLDVTSILGHGPVAAIADGSLKLGDTVLARTANLNDTRVTSTTTDAWAAIVDANNPGRHMTEFTLAAPLKGVGTGDWVEIVDYVVGDTVQFEPTSSSVVG